MSESCVNNMTIFSISFFFSFCSVVVLKRVFVWEVGFKKFFPLVCVPCTFAITHHEKSRTSVTFFGGRTNIEKEYKSDENEPG